jgi:hypothetical protein
MSDKKPSKPSILIGHLEAQQAALHLSDEELCRAWVLSMESLYRSLNKA